MDASIIFKIAGIGILVSVLSVVLKRQDRDDIASLLSLAGIIIVLLIVVDMIGELFSTIKELFFL